MTSLGDSGSLWVMEGGDSRIAPYRVRGRLYVVVVGFGSGVWDLVAAVRLSWAWLRTGFGMALDRPFDWAQDRGLPGGFTVASVEEDLGGGDAVVLVGIVASLRDVVHDVEQVATVVGTREDLVGESDELGRMGAVGSWWS